MIRGDIVVINFDESIPSWYFHHPVVKRVFKMEIENIWTLEVILSSSVTIKHISYNNAAPHQLNEFDNIVLIPITYVTTLQRIRSNKIDKLLK